MSEYIITTPVIWVSDTSLRGWRLLLLSLINRVQAQKLTGWRELLTSARFPVTSTNTGFGACVHIHKHKYVYLKMRLIFYKEGKQKRPSTERSKTFHRWQCVPCLSSLAVKIMSLKIKNDVRKMTKMKEGREEGRREGGKKKEAEYEHYLWLEVPGWNQGAMEDTSLN